MTVFEDLWVYGVAAVSFITWLVRIEFRSNQNSKEIRAVERRLQVQHKEDMGRIEGHLSELRSDIKTLLARLGH